jgi:outer membrane protein assembly factor BamA
MGSRGALVATILCALWQLAWAEGGVVPSVRSRADERLFPRGPDVPDDATLEASGAKIGAVQHVRLNVFDPTIPEEDYALFRLANRIHIVTRESTLGAQLLFKAGDRYDSRLLRESERLLRDKPYLREARIRPVAFHDGTVDIEVITQDTWTLKPEVRFGRSGGRNSSGFGIEEHNLFGTGARFGVVALSGVERDSKQVYYSDPNLAGSRWRLDAQHSWASDGRSSSFSVERPFYALDARWAAGLAWRDERRIDSVYDEGRVVDRFATRERFGRLQLGISEGLRDGWVTRWTAGVTVDERRATPAPDSPPGSPLPRDRRLNYPWIGVELIEDDFRETRNQDQIARTEDLELGWRMRLRLGLSTRALGSDRNAVVFDTRVSKGFQPDARQTLLASIGATGRHEDGALDETTISAAARYHWRHSPRRSTYLALGADRGPDLDSQLTLGGDNGLRGYPYRFRTGQGRWLLTAEERWFTDWYPFRLFNVGGAVFYDMGRVWGDNLVPVPAIPAGVRRNGVLRDIGVGLRLGNSRSAVGSVIHIDVAYPIDREGSMRKVQINVQAKSSF